MNNLLKVTKADLKLSKIIEKQIEKQKEVDKQAYEEEVNNGNNQEK